MLVSRSTRLIFGCLEQGFGLLTVRSAPITANIHTTAATNRRNGILNERPISFRWAWKEAGIDLENSYTHEPLPYVKTGGRDQKGRVQYKHVGGGLKRPFFQLDFKRFGNPDGTPIGERILEVRPTWWRKQHIALVARECSKRWIIATKGMKEGDLILSHSEIPSIPVTPRDGDSHPLGALPVGTVVCCVERHPGEGAKVALSAGITALLTRKFPDGTCAVKMPTRREMIVSQRCNAVVGQVSNEDQKDIKFSKFGEKRWHGIRQRSGKFQLKTGRFGRKIHPIRKPISFIEEFERPEMKLFEFTKPGEPEFKKDKKTGIHFYGENPRFRW